jgi:hypothetical protein
LKLGGRVAMARERQLWFLALCKYQKHTNEIHGKIIKKEQWVVQRTCSKRGGKKKGRRRKKERRKSEKNREK